MRSVSEMASRSYGSTAVAVVAVLLVTSAVVSASSLSVSIGPGAERCFYSLAKANGKVKMDFAVTDGGHLDIDLRVRGSIS